jgi:uncharacterized protein (TIGR02284 family)
MENINNNIVDELNHLIVITLSSQRCYLMGAENVKNEVTKNSFLQCAQERALDIIELRSIIKSLGGSRKEKQEVFEDFNNNEIAAESTFTFVDEYSVINKCIVSNDAVINAYNEALAGNKIFGNIRDILLYQLNGVKNSIKGIKVYSRKVS